MGETGVSLCPWFECYPGLRGDRGTRQGIIAHHLELPENGKTVARHRGADTQNYRVEVVQRPLAVIKSRLARGDVDRHAERIDDLDVVLLAGARRLDDTAVAIEMGIARKQRDFGRARLSTQ